MATFDGINWGMQPAAARADQQMLMNAIGQGIGNYQHGQDRQLKAKQLEMKAQAAQAKQAEFKLGKVADEGFLVLASGGNPTQQQAAAMQVWDAKNRAKVQTDMRGNPITNQSVMSLLGNQPMQTMAQPAQRPMRQGNTGYGQGLNPAIQGQPYDTIAPKQFNDTGFEQPPTQAGSALPVPQIAAPQGAFPDVEQATDMANVDLKKSYAEKSMTSLFAEQKLTKAQSAKQGNYEDNLDTMLKGYEDLLDAGGAVVTLKDDYTVQDVFDNITARLGSSSAGQFAGGAVGTKAQKARDDINKTLPLMFGSLRTLLGMTGKELDTDKERQFYLNALSDPKTNIMSNAETILALSNRFGSGASVARAEKLIERLSGSKEQEAAPVEAASGWSIKKK